MRDWKNTPINDKIEENVEESKNWLPYSDTNVRPFWELGRYINTS